MAGLQWVSTLLPARVTAINPGDQQSMANVRVSIALKPPPEGQVVHIEIPMSVQAARELGYGTDLEVLIRPRELIGGGGGSGGGR